MNSDEKKQQLQKLAEEAGFADIVCWAKRIAQIHHKGQFRADGVTPYIEHLWAVAKLVRRATGGDKTLMALAWLHGIWKEDLNTILLKVVEEKDALYRPMEPLLEDLLSLSTDSLVTRNYVDVIGKAAFMVSAMVSLESEMLLIKLCDMLANTKEGLKIGRTSQLKRYRVAAETLIKCHRKDCNRRHYKIAREIVKLTSSL